MSTNGRVLTAAAPVVVLVHGAWVDGSSWRDVIARLHKYGLHVIAVQNSMISLAADVEGVKRAIHRQRERVILVGHGYGGAVITAAGNDAQVAALVYVAGFAPDVGESTLDVQRRHPRSAYLDHLEVDGAGFAYLPEAAIIEYLAHDLPQVEGRVLAATQAPVRTMALEEKMEVAAWRCRRAWYLVTAEDRMINPRLQREFVRRMRATMVTVQTGHLPLLSDPEATTAIITDAAETVRAQSR